MSRVILPVTDVIFSARLPGTLCGVFPVSVPSPYFKIFPSQCEQYVTVLKLVGAHWEGKILQLKVFGKGVRGKHFPQKGFPPESVG